MGFSNGTYTPPTSSWNPADSGVGATATDWNALLSDISANGLSKCFLRDGSVPMANALLIADGTVSTPGITFNSENSTGFYRVTSGELGVSVGGVAMGNWTANGFNLTTGALQLNGSAGSAGQVLISSGSGSLPAWSSAGSGIVQALGSLGSGTTTIDWSQGDSVAITLTGSSLTLAFTNTPASGQTQTITLILTQDSTGSRTIPTFSSTINWDSGVTPVLTTTANNVDMLQIMAVNISGTTTYYGAQVYGNGA